MPYVIRKKGSKALYLNAHDAFGPLDRARVYPTERDARDKAVTGIDEVVKVEIREVPDTDPPLAGSPRC